MLQLQMTICAGAGILCGITIALILIADAVKRQRQRRAFFGAMRHAQTQYDAVVTARRIRVRL